MSGPAFRSSFWCSAWALAWLLLSANDLAAQSGSDDLGDLDDQSSQGQEQSDESANEAAAPAPPAPERPAQAAPQDEGPSILIQPYAGTGMSTRAFRVPTNVGALELKTSVIPAVEVGLNIWCWPSAAISLGIYVHYQTGLGLTITQHPPFALDNNVRARTERAELGLAPTFSLGRDTGLHIAVPVGLSIRSLWPEIHAEMNGSQMVPGYSLIGPHLRIELLAKLAGPLSVRLGPEVDWITQLDESLLLAGVSNRGYAVGGEAQITVDLSDAWALALVYRESHAFASSSSSVSFQDTERYLTARVTGTF